MVDQPTASLAAPCWVLPYAAATSSAVRVVVWYFRCRKNKAARKLQQEPVQEPQKCRKDSTAGFTVFTVERMGISKRTAGK